MYKIYGLHQPNSPIIFIGYTKYSLKRTLDNHKSKAKEINKITGEFIRKNLKDEWIRKNNFNIEIILIEDNFENEENVINKQIKLIKEYKDNNYTLYNSTDGGKGTTNRKLTNEQKENLRQKNLGKTLSEEHKQKISQSNKNKVINHNTLNALKNYERTPELRNKLSLIKIKSFLIKKGYIIENLTDEEIINLRDKIKNGNK